jgi:hypothetical protein
MREFGSGVVSLFALLLVLEPGNALSDPKVLLQKRIIRD